MKIKVSVCSDDTLYCERLVNYFNSHYYDKFQWNVYTRSGYLQHLFESDTSDLILIGEEMKSELQKLDDAFKAEQSQPYGLTTGSAGGLDEPLRGIFRYRL